MEILARIPDLAQPATRAPTIGRGPADRGRAPREKPPTSTMPPAVASPAEPTSTAGVTPAVPLVGRRHGGPERSLFPATSIVLLAVVAGLIWTAVTWREHGGVFRKSPPERWSEAFATEPAAEETGRLR